MEKELTETWNLAKLVIRNNRLRIHYIICELSCK